MGLDRIYALARQVNQRLHCSQQRAEYIASLLAWEHTISKDSVNLCAEIQAIHAFVFSNLEGDYPIALLNRVQEPTC
jgi:adenosine/AMP kinase